MKKILRTLLVATLFSGIAYGAIVLALLYLGESNHFIYLTTGEAWIVIGVSISGLVFLLLYDIGKILVATKGIYGGGFNS